jgi:hypothetical protein
MRRITVPVIALVEPTEAGHLHEKLQLEKICFRLAALRSRFSG